MSAPRPNLLLLTVDAWRADFVDEYAHVALTPTLHSLLSRAVRFEKAYANAPWTSPALVSLFSGENPAVHDVHYEWSAPRPRGPALCHSLQAAGYQTPNICYLNRVGNYQNLGYRAETAPDYPKSADDELLQKTLRHLGQTRGAPWFLWYHYKFVHLPYWPGPRYRRLFGIDDQQLPERLRTSVCQHFVVPRDAFTLSGDDQETLRRLYAGGVRQMDDFLQRIVEELSAAKLLDDTILVITADHGDELLEHGHVGHASTAHHATLFEEVLRIPLIIVDPRRKTSRVVFERVQGLDLYSTLLSLCGVAARTPAAPNRCEAVDLSSLILNDSLPAALLASRRFYFQSAKMGYLTLAEKAHQLICGLSDGTKKYIWENYESERRLLFDLATDPQETKPLCEGPAVLSAHAELVHFIANAEAQKAARQIADRGDRARIAP